MLSVCFWWPFLGPRWWFQIFFIFQPYLGKWSNLTNIFSNGLKPPTIFFIFFQCCRLPSSIESLDSRIGRAGRDGKPAICELIASDSDFVGVPTTRWPRHHQEKVSVLVLLKRNLFFLRHWSGTSWHKLTLWNEYREYTPVISSIWRITWGIRSARCHHIAKAGQFETQGHTSWLPCRDGGQLPAVFFGLLDSLTKHFRYLKWRYSPMQAVCKAYVRGNLPPK